MSFAWAGYDFISKSAMEPPNIAVGLFMAAFMMTVLNVFQSLVFASIKLWHGSSLSGPLPWMESLSISQRQYVTIYIACLLIVTISLSIWFGLDEVPPQNNIKWVVMGIVGVFLVIVGCLLYWGLRNKRIK
jgi:hypothetical protein